VPRKKPKLNEANTFFPPGFVEDLTSKPNSDADDILQRITERDTRGGEGAEPKHISFWTLADLQKIFHAQVEKMIELGFPEAAKTSSYKFHAMLYGKLFSLLSAVEAEKIQSGKLPFIIVITEKFVSLEEKAARLVIDDKRCKHRLPGKLYPNFSGVVVPDCKMCYLAVDIEIKEIYSCFESSRTIVERARSEDLSPLTIGEVACFASFYPEHIQPKTSGLVVMGSKNNNRTLYRSEYHTDKDWVTTFINLWPDEIALGYDSDAARESGRVIFCRKRIEATS